MNEHQLFQTQDPKEIATEVATPAKPTIQRKKSKHMNRNLYQDKGNGSQNGASSTNKGKSEDEQLMRIDYRGQIEAISKSQAVIEFNMDGTIIRANDNFLNAMGYSLTEIQGQHHSMFVDTEYGRSFAYRDFWAKLNRGEYLSDEFKRIAKGGREVYIQASYNPILDLNGRPFKVVKYATDVTDQKLKNIDYQGQLEAIGRSNAVIEFNMDGTIITANDNFLKTLGYSLAEIKGK